MLAGLTPKVSLKAQYQDQDAPPVELPYPSMVGRPKERVTDYENDPFIIAIEERLRCTCGCNLDVYTCRTTDFTCATSPAMHREVVKLVEQGSTAEEVIDFFVAEHGELVLMAPKKEGFNLVGYVLPGMAITAVGAVMLWMLARRNKLTAAATVSDRGFGQGSGISAEDAVRLESELAELE
jgi:cytochrome c-type biogenesis protein CcmH